MSTRPPAVPCLVCKRPTESRQQRCRDHRIKAEALRLPPGRWVPNGRGVVVYRGIDGLPVEREEVA